MVERRYKRNVQSTVGLTSQNGSCRRAGSKLAPRGDLTSLPDLPKFMLRKYIYLVFQPGGWLNESCSCCGDTALEVILKGSLGTMAIATRLTLVTDHAILANLISCIVR